MNCRILHCNTSEVCGYWALLNYTIEPLFLVMSNFDFPQVAVT